VTADSCTPFYELCAELWDGDDDTTAAAIAARLHVSNRAAEVLNPALARIVAEWARCNVRRVERRAFGRNPGADSVAARAELMLEVFPLGDGRLVSWGSATVDDHRQRIELLDKLRSGLSATIGRHETAIALLAETGAINLDAVADQWQHLLEVHS